MKETTPVYTATIKTTRSKKPSRVDGFTLTEVIDWLSVYAGSNVTVEHVEISITQ